MNKREGKEIGERLLEIYGGILFNAPTFERGEKIACSYDFANPKYEELKSQYPILQVAGKGSDFERALRLCRWLAPNLSHQGDFSLTGNVEINAISLLDYAFGKKERGINCVCKSKILVECCLALGIYARRIGLYPNSPYDTDNHVVTEIYDRKKSKWIMLDPTSGGYFSDGKTPLSCLEMRECFALNGQASIVLPRQSAAKIESLVEKNLSWNYYYAKNCYYLTVETVTGFGQNDADSAYILPVGFDCKAQRRQNAEYMVKIAMKESWGEAAVKSLEKRALAFDNFKPCVGSTDLWNAPV